MPYALPVPQNVTVNIFRGANPGSPIPQGAPAVPNVTAYLKPVPQAGRYGSAAWLKWTHQLILPPETDIRDAYNSQLDPARNNDIADTVTVTDSNGNVVPYYVVFVEDAFRGSPFWQVIAWLDRFQPQQWPTDGI